MNWTEVVLTVWPIAVSITPLIILGGFAWLQTKFPSKTELGTIENDVHKAADRIIILEERFAAIQAELQREPSREALINAMGDLRERVGRMEAGFESMVHQLGTTNNYLHTLIEQGMHRK